MLSEVFQFLGKLLGSREKTWALEKRSWEGIIRVWKFLIELLVSSFWDHAKEGAPDESTNHIRYFKTSSNQRGEA